MSKMHLAEEHPRESQICGLAVSFMFTLCGRSLSARVNAANCIEDTTCKACLRTYHKSVKP